ncbi:hypothetical protein GW7_02067, partial [Heterocephalus glaber]
DSSASAPQSAGIIGLCHHAWLFIAFLKDEFLLSKAGLRTHRDPPASASQSAGVTGVHHH